MTKLLTIPTRSKAVYALVKVHYEKTYTVTPDAFKGAEIVGYAYSASPAVLARARRLGAKLLRIQDGAVRLEVRS